MDVPQDLRYTSDHEWARLEDDEGQGRSHRFRPGGARRHRLRPTAGRRRPGRQGRGARRIESTKSVSQVYAPVGGTIVEVNSALGEQPERINSDAYGEGWLCIIEPSALSELEELLDAAAYLKLTES